MSNACDSCDTTYAQVQHVLELVQPIFDALGVRPAVNRRRIATREEAQALGLRGSPTIRLGDGSRVEIVPAHPDLSERRLWSWRDRMHAELPTGLFIDGLLRAYTLAGRRDEQVATESAGEMPPYLEQYLRADVGPSTPAMTSASSSHCCAG